MEIKRAKERVTAQAKACSGEDPGCLLAVLSPWIATNYGCPMGMTAFRSFLKLPLP